MTHADRASRRLAVYVNIAKLLLLASLAPAVIAGIAQRASHLDPGAADGVVAMTMTIGALGAVAGALGLGTLADLGTPTVRSRWLWVLAGTGVGTAGLALLIASRSSLALAAGWAMAQLGYSGGMAVLRALLAAALPNHRRRGAVVVVLGGYAGMALPLVVLLIAPRLVWETTAGLAALSLAVPIVFLQGGRPRGRAVADQPQPAPAPAPLAPPGRPLGRFAVLAIQASTNVVLAAFLAYHPLDLAARAGPVANVPVRASILVLGAAVLGLVAVSTALLRRPELIANGRRAVAVAGGVLAVSLALRAIAEPLPLLAVAAALSGGAVGLNNSALLAAALERAPQARHGRYLGAYSAAGALGQLTGPSLALGLLTLAAGEYRTMFLALALIPACWAVLLRVRRPDSRRGLRDRLPTAA